MAKILSVKYNKKPFYTVSIVLPAGDLMLDSKILVLNKEVREKHTLSDSST